MPTQSMQARRSKRIADRSEIEHISNPENDSHCTDIISKKIRLSEQNFSEDCIPKHIQLSNVVVDSPRPTQIEHVSNLSTAGQSLSRTNSVDILPTPNESIVPNCDDAISPSNLRAEKTNTSLQQRRLFRGEHYVEIPGSHTPKILNLAPSESIDDSPRRNSSISPRSIVDVNRYKLKIAELTLEKQTMLNATEAMSEKCQLLEEQMIRQKQEIAALETLLNRTKPKGRKSSRNGF